ncbi:MAG: 3-oxoacyl-ACP reductase FabG [Halobacteriovoraceae bacterium]|nr:3-oxoacyl-ACP reductase FabG [Halobacteriovoraceae bacterium]
MFDFKDQRIIITGGTRGIGKAISQAFLKQGGTVIATYAGNDSAAQAFLSENEACASRLEVRKFDVSKVDEVKTFFEYVGEKYPSIEVLVNNCGIRKDALLPMMKEENWKKVLEINLDGTFYMTKYAVKSFLRSRYGRIVNISSIGGSIGLPGQANYSAAKAAQVAMGKSLSKEVAKKNITVNSICPGFIQTELVDDLPDSLVANYKEQIPMKRFGTVDEVAYGVLVMASKEASYINGASLEISGGL